jgi:uncharacterized membrane protein YfcA
MTWQFVLAGALVGILVGMTGMGGGSLMTPILILLFGFDAKVAVGTDILHGAVFKSFGAARHRMLGTVHGHLALWMLLGSAPLSLVGVQIASGFGEGTNSTMQKIVGGALILGGIGFAVKTFVKGRSDDAPFLLTRRDKLNAVAIGAIGGFVVGLTSVGSGTFFGLAMLLLFPLTAPKVVGTDITHAAALLWVAGVGHLVHGNVNLHAMAWLLVGSIPGVLLGSQMSISIPERSLRFSFGLVLILSGIKLVDVPHSTLIIVVSLAVAVAALIVYVAKHGLAHSLPGAGEPTAAVDVHSPERVPAQAPLDGSSVRAAGSHGSSVRRH